MTGLKKKMEIQSEVELTKVIKPFIENKVTLKADLITELNDFKERYIALEEKYKKDIEFLETENTKLKEANKTFSDEVNSLKQRVQNLEAENLLVSKETKSGEFFKCYECSFETHQKSVLLCHLFDKHAWKRIKMGKNQT